MSAESDRLKARLASGVAWATGTRIIGQVLNWAMTLVVIRFLTPADYGLMALVMAVTGFLQGLTTVGFYDALVQTRSLDVLLWRRSFGVIVVVSCSLALVLCLLAYPLAALFGEPRFASLLQVASLVLPIGAPTAVARARLDRDLSFKQTSRIDMFTGIGSGLLVLALAVAGLGVWSLMVGMLAGSLFSTVALWNLAPFRHWPLFSLHGLDGVLRLSGYRTVENFLWYIGQQIDVLLVGKLLGDQTLGVYAVARTVAALPVNKIGAIVRAVSASTFSRLQDDRERAVSYLLGIMRILAFIAFPVFFGMAAVAPELVAVVLSNRWNEAALPLAILAVGMAGRPSGLAMAPFLMALGEYRYSLANSFVSLALFAAAYSAGSFWGLIGVCVAGAVAYPFQLMFQVKRIAKITGASFGGIMATLVRPLCSASAMWACGALARVPIGADGPPAVRLALLVAVGAVAYAAMAWLMCRDILREVVLLAPGGAALARRI